MLRVIVMLSFAAALLAFAVTVNSGLVASKVETHIGWRAKSERVSGSGTAGAHTSLVSRAKDLIQNIIQKETEPPKSNLQEFLDRRRRDTAPFDTRR